MVKAACVDKNGVRKGAWSEEEDNKLRAYVLRYGHWNWRLLPKYAGLERCGKSCRLRWMNYLKPGVRRGNYTQEERDLITKLHDELGNKWSAIAAKLPGRSDNDAKNYWHAHIQKRSRSRASTKPCKQAAETSLEEKPSEKIHNLDEKPSDLCILESLSSSDSGANWDLDSSTSVERNCSGVLSGSGSLGLNLEAYDDSASPSDPFLELIQDNFWTEPFVLDTSDSVGFSFSGFDEGGVFPPNLSSYYDAISLS